MIWFYPGSKETKISLILHHTFSTLNAVAKRSGATCQFLLSHNVENDFFRVDILGFVELHPSAVTSLLDFISRLEEDKFQCYNFLTSSQYFLTNFHNDAMPRSMLVSQNPLLS